MFASNALVLAMHPEAIASALINDIRFARVEWTSSWQDALTLADTAAFDVLITQDTLCGADGEHLLKTVASRLPVTPPRVLLLRSLSAKPYLHHKHADQSVPYDSPVCEIVNHATRMMDSPLPALCQDHFSVRLDLSHRFLEQMKFPRHLKGTEAIAYGSSLLSCSLRNDWPMKGWLYRHIAKALSCPIASVERNIRTAAEYAWLRGDLDKLQQYFGLSYDAEKGKPTNAELLYTIADHIRRSYASAPA